jgi:ribosomal protein L16 Arg81 hydroxylase
MHIGENNENNETRTVEYRQISDKLRTWIAESLCSGISTATIAAVLRQKNIREDEIAEEIRQAEASPYLGMAKRLLSRNKRYEWLLNKYGKLNAMSKDRLAVDRCSRLEPEAFFENYYFRNRPVIMTDAVNDWPAFGLWGLDYFREKFGDEQVEMQINRSASNERYGPLPSHFSKMVPLREYIELVEKHSPTNEIYLSRWNNKKCREWVKKLSADLRQWPYTGPMGEGSVWFGPAGTITPLHFDMVNILMTQMVGRKRIFLAPSYHAVHLLSDTNETFAYSDVDPAAIDHERFPQAKNVGFIELILQPKEVLFIPAGWWHAVTALDISVTFTIENFIHDNTK